MQERGSGPARVSWQDHPGEFVTIHVPERSVAAKNAPAFVKRADETVEVVRDLLDPPEGKDRVEVYLVDPVVEAPAALTPSGGDGQPAATSAQADRAREAVGAGGLVHVVQAEASPATLAIPLTRFLLGKWYGPGAAAAEVFADGIAGLASERSGGATVQDADKRVRAALESGEELSLLTYGSIDDPVTRGAVATSFVAFLLRSTEPGSISKFLETVDPGRREDAATAAFDRPLGALEQQWMENLFGAGTGSTTASLRFLAPLLKPHLWRYGETIVYMVIAVAFTISVPLISGCIVDSLGRTAGEPAADGFCGFVIPTLSSGRVVAVVLVLFFAYILESLLTLRRTQVELHLFNHIGLDLRERMFARLLRLPHRFYAEAKVGDLSARLSEDLDELQTSMQGIFGGGVFMALTSILAAATALTQNVLVGGLVLLLIPVFILANRVLGSRIAQASFEQQELGGETASVLQENLSAHAVIKAYGLEERSIKTYHSRLTAVLRSTLRLSLIGNLYERTINFSTTVAQLIVLAVGSVLVIGGTIQDPGTMVALLLLLPSIIVPIGSLADIGQAAQMAAGSIQRAREILEEPIDIEEKPDAVDMPVLEREIRFENVTFGYEPERAILKDLSLTIPKGTNLAIVGPSGSGKSTIVNLILRFWDPGSGRVMFDDRDIRDVTLSSLRGQIGIVFQETFVFNSTLRDNIAIGRPDATDAEVDAAARAAQLESLIESLPQGMDTVLGERGVRMSGGQRQRLAIARALLRDPAVLILDEATSALDARTESEILEVLSSVVKSRTTIAITHRLLMAAGADLIFVLDQGRVVEQGSHDELAAAGGLYQRLWEEQTQHVTPGGRPRVGLEAARLRTIPLFAELDADALGRVSERLLPEKYASGDEIVRQGDMGDKLYFIARGEVEVVLSDGRSEHRVNLLKEGDYFGEYALLTGEERSATVRAMQPTEVYTLSQRDFSELVEAQPELQETIADFLAQRTAAYAAAAEAVGVGGDAGMPEPLSQ